MSRFTKTVIDKSKRRIISNKDYLPAFIASVFSVLFALSIVGELSNLVEGYVLIFLGVFITLFLLLNETIKVKEVKKLFRGKRWSILPFLITFFISVTLSSVGIWFWTNKTVKIENEAKIQTSETESLIKKKYTAKIDSVSQITFVDSLLIKDLQYWQKELKYFNYRYRNDSTAKRSSMIANVQMAQKRFDDAKKEYNENKDKQIARINELMVAELSSIKNYYDSEIDKMDRNWLVSMIFLVMILITEFAIIILNKNIAQKEKELDQFLNSKLVKTYITGRNILYTLFLTKDVHGMVNINKAKYSYANKRNLSWEEIKAIYNSFITLGILGKTVIRETAKNRMIWNHVELELDQALKVYDNHSEKYFQII
jgi:hypothetical protein